MAKRKLMETWVECNGKMCPMEKVLAGSMSPVHGTPHRVVWVVLGTFWISLDLLAIMMIVSNRIKLVNSPDKIGGTRRPSKRDHLDH